ncbi:Uncharacterized protein TCM_037122 [Theobroma cacao]|uniref:Uncharacterized protein n=1 Tax=Theobroma cacao TaxID=3641 RepID=A0A061GIE1_THECC|nr:Uncharacterized protein TCM_037122 [Theobroma cacao]
MKAERNLTKPREKIHEPGLLSIQKRIQIQTISCAVELCSTVFGSSSLLVKRALTSPQHLDYFCNGYGLIIARQQLSF